MLVLTVGFDRKCDFVAFLNQQDCKNIMGLCEICKKDKSLIEIYMETRDINFLSDILTDYILFPVRKQIAYKYMDDFVDFLSDSEKRYIIANLPYEKYLDTIKEKICNYIEKNSYIDISGFVRFRMPDFERNIIADLNYECESYLRIREYEDMVQFLKAYIKNSESSGTCILRFDETRHYTITGENGENTGMNNDEELILGDLLRLMPREIIVLNESLASKTVKELLEEIFEGKIEFRS